MAIVRQVSSAEYLGRKNAGHYLAKVFILGGGTLRVSAAAFEREETDQAEKSVESRRNGCASPMVVTSRRFLSFLLWSSWFGFQSFDDSVSEKHIFKTHERNE